MRARTRKKPRRLFSLFALVVFIAFIYYLASLPIWQIREVVVNGAKILDPDEVKVLAGIPLSENLFFASLTKSRNNLSKISAIKSFNIFRLPPGTILISIKERRPIATVVFKNKSLVVDQDGYVVNPHASLKVNLPQLADLPIVTGINEQTALRGDHLEATTACVVAELTGTLTKSLGVSRIYLELGELKEVNFLLDDLLRVKVGGADDLKHKLAVFEALLPVVAGRWTQVEYVDVRYPENPVIKFK